jgi:hypothetical protein
MRQSAATLYASSQGDELHQSCMPSYLVTSAHAATFQGTSEVRASAAVPIRRLEPCSCPRCALLGCTVAWCCSSRRELPLCGSSWCPPPTRVCRHRAAAARAIRARCGDQLPVAPETDGRRTAAARSLSLHQYRTLARVSARPLTCAHERGRSSLNFARTRPRCRPTAAEKREHNRGESLKPARKTRSSHLK